jgi:hypothetical protein
VRDALRRVLADALDDRGRASGDSTTPSIQHIFSMVLEHELMHQETLLYMLRELPRAKKVRPTGAGDDLPTHVPSKSPSRSKIRVPGGKVTLGAPKN